MRWLSLLVVFLLGCPMKATPTFTRPPLPFAALVGPVIIAHRGGSLEAPENTVASVKHGIRIGSDWQEIDVTLTSDGKVVVIHDDTLERTTGVAGLVEEKTLDQLRQLDAGDPKWADYVAAKLASLGIEPPSFTGKFRGERIPVLEEILALDDARLMIELKTTTRTKELAQKVVDLVHAENAAGRVALGSFDPALLEAVNARDSGLPLIGIVEDAPSIERMLKLPLAVLAVNVELAELALHHAPPGVAVWTWTVYTASEAERLAELGVHGIITDAPTKVVSALRREQDTHVPLGR